MKRSLVLSVVLLAALQLGAQSYLEIIQSANPDIAAARRAFDSVWQDRPYERGMGYKTFKRWEWLWKQRRLADGSLPHMGVAWNEWNKYKSNRNNAALRTTAANWTFKGPGYSGSGYNGIGRLNTIAFHPTDPNTFYVGAPSGGLWKTTTGGTSWAPLTDNLPVIGISDIAIDPVNPNNIYIVTGDGDGGDTYSIGVLKSTDAGASWNTTGMSWNVTSFKQIRRIQINPANPQVLIIAASDGIWRSINGGTSWVLSNGGSFNDIEFKPGDPNTVYASSFLSSSSIYRSVNGGATFSAMHTVSGGRRLNIAVSAADPNLVQVVACNSSGGLHSFTKSTDGGATFTQYFTGTGTTNYLSSSVTASGTSGQGTYDLAFNISPVDANLLFLGGVNTWSSSDGGINWNLKTQWSSGLGGGVPTVHADKHFIAFHPLNPTVMYECNDGGLYRTLDNGSNWTDLSNGIGISQIYRLGTSATVPNQVLIGLQDNSTKELRNNAWFERMATGDGFESIIDYTNSQTLFVSSYYGSIRRSVNGGSNWTTVANNNSSGVNGAGPWLSPYIMHPTDNQTLLLGKYDLFRSTNAGTNWEQLTSWGGNTDITAIAYAPSDLNTIYVARETGLYKTTDGGTTWALAYGASTSISYIAVHPTNPQRLWITFSGYSTSNKVRESTNGGTSFTDIRGTLPNLPVNCIVYQNGSNNGLYIGTDIGVYYRDATMTDWMPYQTGLPNVIVNELEISYSNSKLWAATYGRGLWSSDLYGTAACAAPAAPTSGGNQTVCQNAAPGTLTVTPPAGMLVDWYNTASGGTALATGSNTYSSSTAGTYYAETRDGISGCVSSTRTAVTLTFTPAPTSAPFITSGGVTSVCPGGSVTLTSSVAGSNQWYFNGSIVPGAIAQTYAATLSGSYTVRSVSNGCSSPSSASFFLGAAAGPAQPTITVSGNVLQSSAAAGNQWYLNGAVISGATGQTYTPATSGSYTVRVTANGCTSLESAPHNYVSTAINSPALERNLTVGPNPARRNLSVQYRGNAAQFEIELLDITGRNVLKQGRFQTGYTMDLQGQPAGSYIVRIVNKRTGEKVQKIIVKQ